MHGDRVWRAVVELVRRLPARGGAGPATSYAASVLGLGTVTGRLRAGYAADLLVVEGDVRADVEALGRPLAVLVRGSAVAISG